MIIINNNPDNKGIYMNMITLSKAEKENEDWKNKKKRLLDKPPSFDFKEDNW